jgi:hypothetical protein
MKIGSCELQSPFEEPNEFAKITRPEFNKLTQLTDGQDPQHDEETALALIKLEFARKQTLMAKGGSLPQAMTQAQQFEQLWRERLAVTAAPAKQYRPESVSPETQFSNMWRERLATPGR